MSMLLHKDDLGFCVTHFALGPPAWAWLQIGLARIIYLRCIYRVGQNRIYTYIYTVYLVISKPKIPYVHCIYMVLANPMHKRYFWQGNHQIYGHIRCMYTALANPSYIPKAMSRSALCVMLLAHRGRLSEQARAKIHNRHRHATFCTCILRSCLLNVYVTHHTGAVFLNELEPKPTIGIGMPPFVPAFLDPVYWMCMWHTTQGPPI